MGGGGEKERGTEKEGGGGRGVKLRGKSVRGRGGGRKDTKYTK